MSKGFEQSMGSGHSALAADPSFTISHPVTVTVRGAATSGLPGTGDSFLPVAIGLAVLLAGLAFVVCFLYTRNKKRSQAQTETKARARGQAQAQARTQVKAYQLILLPLLVATFAFGILLNMSPRLAEAAPGGGTHITVEKGKGATARFNVSVDATATQSRYLDIVAALEDSFPGVSFSLDGDSFDSAGDTAVKQVSDPQNQSGGVYTLTLTAQVSKDLKVGSYTHNVKFTVIDKRMALAVSGVTPQDRVYDGTQDVTVSGTPTLTGLAAGDQVSLSNPSYTVDDANAGTDKPVSAHDTLSGSDAFKYLLSGALSPDPDVTITPAPLAFTGDLSVTKAYDGTPDIDPASIQVTNPTSFSGLVGQEGFTLSTAGITSAAFADAAAGANKPVAYTGAFSLSDPKGGALASNYALTQPAFSGTIDAPPAPDNIELEAVITAPGQRVSVNKYFANGFTVDWGDGSAVQDVTNNIIHTYMTAGTYTITLTSALTGNPYAAWFFTDATIPLVPANDSTAGSVRVSHMPPMTAFMTDATTAPAYFFDSFNYRGALTGLPVGSFDTRGITTTGDRFFNRFNSEGTLTTLPEASFDTSNITKPGDDFFSRFNESGYFTSLPDGSFDIRGITTVGDGFFTSFGRYARLSSLPSGSFDTSNITAVGNDFFSGFNSDGALTSLPLNSFDTSNITAVGNDFFSGFNSDGALTSLPLNSFDTSNITTTGNGFFGAFTYSAQLTSLPDGSFGTSNITAEGSDFFSNFNGYGALTSLPVGSFDISTIANPGNNFFGGFNNRGAIVSLPDGSFDTSNITAVGSDFFSGFNDQGALVSLPDGSFNTGNITKVDDRFFSGFNSEGALISLPLGSFGTSNITMVGSDFFSGFNDRGKLAALPDASFDTSSITAVGSDFFSFFNFGGVVTSLPVGSFGISNITAVGDSFFSGFNFNGSLTSLPVGSFDTSTITTVGNNFFGHFNRSGALASLPDGSFDSSNVTTAGDTFFSHFNYLGSLGSLPTSFKWPQFDAATASKDKSFYLAFNSRSTLNRSAQDIINGCATPNIDRDTFSRNQPGYNTLDPNWQE